MTCGHHSVTSLLCLSGFSNLSLGPGGMCVRGEGWSRRGWLCGVCCGNQGHRRPNESTGLFSECSLGGVHYPHRPGGSAWFWKQRRGQRFLANRSGVGRSIRPWRPCSEAVMGPLGAETSVAYGGQVCGGPPYEAMITMCGFRAEILRPG